jgi:hypothetical protein
MSAYISRRLNRTQEVIGSIPFRSTKAKAEIRRQRAEVLPACAAALAGSTHPNPYSLSAQRVRALASVDPISGDNTTLT